MSEDDRAAVRIIRVEELGGMDVLSAVGGRPDFPRHLHETFTLGTIERGAVVNVSGGRRTRLGPGSVYAFDPGDVHDGRAIDGARVDQSAFYPAETALDALAAEAGLRGEGRFRGLAVRAPRTAARLTALRRCLTGPAARLEREAAVADAFTALLVEHGRSRRTARPAGVEPGGVARAREYLEAHLCEDVSIATLAAVAGLSSGYLSRAFRRALGLPPHAWLIQRRVERARALIAAGEPLADVALAVGFVDQSHLNLHFRRTVGTTAGRYARGLFLPRRGPANARR